MSRSIFTLFLWCVSQFDTLQAIQSLLGSCSRWRYDACLTDVIITRNFSTKSYRMQTVLWMIWSILWLQAENMVTKMEDQAIALGDFGLSMFKLCKFESDEGACLGRYTHQGAATNAIAADAKRTGAVSNVLVEILQKLSSSFQFRVAGNMLSLKMLLVELTNAPGKCLTNLSVNIVARLLFSDPENGLSPLVLQQLLASLARDNMGALLFKKRLSTILIRLEL